MASEWHARIIRTTDQRSGRAAGQSLVSAARQQYQAAERAVRPERVHRAARARFARGHVGHEPWITAYPLRTPRSPTGHTSRRPSWNIRNISAVQRPMPRTSVSSRDDLRRPRAAPRGRARRRRRATFSARSRIDAALFPDSPAARIVSTGRASTASRVWRCRRAPARADRGSCAPRPPASCWKQMARTSSAKCVRRGRPRRRSAGPNARRRSGRTAAPGGRAPQFPRPPPGAPRAAASAGFAPVASSRPCFRRFTAVSSVCSRPPSRSRRSSGAVAAAATPRSATSRCRRRPTVTRGADEHHVVHRDGEAQITKVDVYDSPGRRHSRRASSTTRGSTTPTVPTVEGAAGVPGQGAAAPTGGCRCCCRAPERQHRLGEDRRRHAHAQPVPHQRRARRAHHHGEQRRPTSIYTGPVAVGATDPPLPDVGQAHPHAHRRVLPPGPAAGPRPQHGVRPVRLRLVEPLRVARHVRRGRRRGRHPRQQRRLGARHGRHARLHPDGQRRHHDAGEAAAARHAGRPSSPDADAAAHRWFAARHVGRCPRCCCSVQSPASGPPTRGRRRSPRRAARCHRRPARTSSPSSTRRCSRSVCA